MNTKLLAFCLGDGTIGKNYMLHIVHCFKQKEYIEWKSSIINEEIPCTLPVFFENNGYPAFRIHTKTNKQNEYDLKEIKEKLSKFGMSFTIKKDKGLYSIRCGTKSARKFLNLIESEHPDFECFKDTKFQETKTNFTSFT